MNTFLFVFSLFIVSIQNFWQLTVIASETSTSITSTLENTSTGTTYIATTGSSMNYSDTSTITMSTATITHTSTSQTTQNSNTTTTITTSVIVVKGEPPPTRSAQLGAAGLAGYVWGKRKERRELGNAYVTYQDNGSDSPQYGHIHYGSQGVRYNQKHRHHHQTDYNATGR